MKIYCQEDEKSDFSTVVTSWQNTTLENINIIAKFSAKTMRSTTTEFLANQDSIFKNAVKNRLRPLVSSDKVFEDLLSRLRLDIDCLNPENLPIIDNNLMNGVNGALIKVMYFIYLFNN